MGRLQVLRGPHLGRCGQVPSPRADASGKTAFMSTPFLHGFSGFQLGGPLGLLSRPPPGPPLAPLQAPSSPLVRAGPRGPHRTPCAPRH